MTKLVVWDAYTGRLQVIANVGVITGCGNLHGILGRSAAFVEAVGMVPLKQVWLFPATMKPLEPVREMIGMKWSCTKNHRKIRHIEWRKESV